MSGSTRKLVIFDCDGVLVDSEPISFSVLRAMLEEQGLAVSEDLAYRDFLGRSMASIVDRVAIDHGIEISAETLGQMRGRLFDRFRAELKPMPGIAATLAAMPHAFCVASSSQLERIRLCLEVTGLIDFFEPNIFSASMVTNGKPAPDLFLHAARNMGYDPADCIVVEDSPAGLSAAHAAGMTAIAFVGGAHAVPSNLRAAAERLKPDAVVEDMGALLGTIAGSIGGWTV